MAGSDGKQFDKEGLLKDTRRIIEKAKERDAALQQICALLEEDVETFDWVGFYLVDPENPGELVLGPYVGEPTDHTRIPFGRGICGQAAERKDTFVVQDVSKETNYLSCSPHVEAEIVVPIMAGDKVLGELDIDSHTRDSISDELRDLCEQICKQLEPLLVSTENDQKESV